MNKLGVKITILAIVVFGNSVGQGLARQSVDVAEIKMENSYSKGLSGILISLSLAIEMNFEEDLVLKYELNGEEHSRELSKLSTQKPVKSFQIFYPFCKLVKTSGMHTIHFVLKGIATENDDTPLTLTGITTGTIEVDIPSMYSVKVKVDFVKVSKTNKKGNAWDYHIFSTKESDNYPDLMYTIESDYNELSRGSVSAVFFSSHRQNDTLQAIWPSFSDKLYLCEGDKVYVCIKDGDTVFHDEIGCIELDQLKKMKSGNRKAFDSVLEFAASIIID